MLKWRCLDVCYDVKNTMSSEHCVSAGIESSNIQCVESTGYILSTFLKCSVVNFSIYIFLIVRYVSKRKQIRWPDHFSLHKPWATDQPRTAIVSTTVTWCKWRHGTSFVMDGWLSPWKNTWKFHIAYQWRCYGYKGNFTPLF